ncbi:MAG: hypothetical protein IJ188_08650 [Clostridia bacterium]|nr:hypothetical protein [Clostridia bacterium]
MRKIMSLIIAFMLALPAAAFAKGKYVTVQELYSQYDGNRWQDEYQTVRGETIVVDTTIMVPDVETAPVIRVKTHPELDEAVYEVYGRYPRNWRKVDEANWIRSDNVDITIAMDQNWEFNRPDKYAGRCHEWGEVFLPDEIDWNLKAENNDMSMGEAYSQITAQLNEIMENYGGGSVDMQLRDAYTFGLYRDKDNAPLVDHCGYGFDFKQGIRGIPALGNAHLTYQHGRMRTNHRWEGVYDNWINLQISSLVSYSMSVHLWQEEGCLYEDIPLVPFEAGKPAIEKMIQDGLIRKIRRVQLGYVAYVESDHNTKHWILVPTWVVDCDWFPSAKDDFWKEEFQVEFNPYARSGSHLLYVNAQTGKLLDPMDTSKKRSDVSTIRTW